MLEILLQCFLIACGVDEKSDTILIIYSFMGDLLFSFCEVLEFSVYLLSWIFYQNVSRSQLSAPPPATHLFETL